MAMLKTETRKISFRGLLTKGRRNSIFFDDKVYGNIATANADLLLKKICLITSTSYDIRIT